MKEHHFEVEEAIQYGTECAVILYNIRFWIEKNQANNINYHEERYWTFNSIEAWVTLFPYMTKEQIRRKLEKLEKMGVLITGNFNKSKYDRTKWYSLKDQIHLAKLPNQFGEITKPIPDNKQQIINTDRIQESENFEKFYFAYPKHQAKGQAKKAFEKAIKKTDLDTMLKAIERQKLSKQWQDKQYIPYPATWLNGERWLDDVAPKSLQDIANECKARALAEVGEDRDWEPRAKNYYLELVDCSTNGDITYFWKHPKWQAIAGIINLF